MNEADFQLSSVLGQTSLDAAAAGWLLLDYITGLNRGIRYSCNGRQIHFGHERPFCILEPRGDRLDGRLHPPPGRATKAIRFQLNSMADMTPDLQNQIRRLAGSME